MQPESEPVLYDGGVIAITQLVASVDISKAHQVYTPVAQALALPALLSVSCPD